MYQKQPTERHGAAKQALKGNRESATILTGFAGTGKTYAATEAGLEFLGGKLESSKRGGHKRIIYIRNATPYGDDIGFLPGSEIEKMLPWMAPLVDNLEEFGFGRENVVDAIQRGVIEAVPLSLVGGRSFHNSFIIYDECQNASFMQLCMGLQRCGRGSKIVYCGDALQTAGGYQASLGINKFIKRAEAKDINIINFIKEDVMRSGIALIGAEMMNEAMQEGEVC